MTSFWHTRAPTQTHTHRKTQEAMLSPNVINAVKRLTSGYLFKSRHQTHSFFSSYLLRSQKLLSGEKRRFSERRLGQRTRPRTRPDSLSLSLALFHHLQMERAAPAPRSSPDKAAHCQTHNGQWGLGGGGGLIVTK